MIHIKRLDAFLLVSYQIFQFVDLIPIFSWKSSGPILQSIIPLKGQLKGTAITILIGQWFFMEWVGNVMLFDTLFNELVKDSVCLLVQFLLAHNFAFLKVDYWSTDWIQQLMCIQQRLGRQLKCFCIFQECHNFGLLVWII